MSVADKLDAARLSLAGSNVAKAICKASSREVMGPKKKHVDYLLSCTQNEMMNLSFMIDWLFERCAMSSWVIVSKALVTFHHLMSAGNERFFQLMPSRASLWNLESFLDKSSVIGNDMSLFIRRYSSYLRQKTRSYAEMNYDFCRLVRGPSGVLRTLDTSGLLKTVIEIQILLDMLLEVDLQSSEFSNGIINSAFVLLFKDIIKLFACYNDAMINMLEKYYDMSKDHCKESLELYKKFVTRIDSVKKFLKVAQDVGVSKDAIPEMVEAPSSLLSALENHYQSLLKGQVPTSSAKQPSLAPIIIPPVSEQVHLNEGENETVESPEEIKEPSEPKTLLQTTDTAQSASEDPWQTLFEPERQPLRNTTPKTNQDDLLELHDVFQAHQASTAAYPVNPIFGGAGPGPIPLGPTGISTSLQPVSGFSQPNSWRQNGKKTGVARNNDPFEANAGVGPQIGSDILQPMNRPQQQRATQPVAEAPKGDLNSTLTKVVNSLDNFDLTSSTGVVGSTGSGHQWELPKPKIKTGGADFHMSATSGVTLPPTNPVSSGLPMPSTRFTLPPTAPATGIAHQQQMIRPVFTRPATFGVQPAAYGQQSAMRPQASVFPQQNVRPTNPFDNPVPGN